MITVHHLNNSRSQRVIWLLEELGVDYEIKRYERDPKTMLAPKALLKIHPLGKSPVITDGDITVAESGAIIEYLIDRYDIEHKLSPSPGTPTRLRYTYWLHFAEGSAISPLLLKLVFNKVEKTPMLFFVKPIVRAISKNIKASFIDLQIYAQLNHVESELGKSTCRWSFNGCRYPNEFSVRSRRSTWHVGRKLPQNHGVLAARARPGGL